MSRLVVEVKRTIGQKQNDVFVLGDESLLAEPIASREPAPAAVTEAREGSGSLPFSAPVPQAGLSVGTALGARRFAVLSLGAAAAATLGMLELSSPGSAHTQSDLTSPRSALVAKPAPSFPAPAAHPAPARPVDPKPKSKPRPRHLEVRLRPRDIQRSETEREPNPEQAPVSSPVETPVPPPAPVTSPAPAPAPPPTVPSPPPPSSGVGSGSVESFGFEH